MELERRMTSQILPIALGRLLIVSLLIIHCEIHPVSTEYKVIEVPNVTLVYPLISGKYPPNSIEHWRFKFPKMLNFTIEIKHLDLEKSNGCKADSLKLYDRIRKQLQVYCGERSVYSNSSRYEFFTYDLLVTFVSDSSWEGTGFVLETFGYTPSFDVTVIQEDAECRGYEVAERIEISAAYEIYTFVMNKYKLYIRIHRKTNKDDCFMIPFLSTRHNSAHIDQLARYVYYRICHKGYRENESVFLFDGTEYYPIGKCFDGLLWQLSTDFSRIFRTDWNSGRKCQETLCLEDRETIISHSCGAIDHAVNFDYGCRFRLSRSQHMWTIKLSSLWGDYRIGNNDSLMIISEKYKDTRQDVTTVISNHIINKKRPFYYSSLPGAELQVSTVHANYINVRFSQENSSNTPFHLLSNVTKDGSSCVVYKEHCYSFVFLRDATTWRSSQLQCQSIGGYLVTINTYDELNFIKACLEELWEKEFYGRDRGLILIGLSDAFQTGSYRWEDGSPLTVSDWYYPFAVSRNVLPESPRPPLDLSKIQPVIDPLQRCVAMVPGNPLFSTNWRKIPCGNFTASVNVYSICEMETGPNTQQQKYSSIKEPNKKNTVVQCAPKWTFVQGRCFRLVKIETEIFPFSLVNGVCRDICGEFIDVGNGLSKYIIPMRFASTGIRLLFKHGISYCLNPWLQYPSNDKLYKDRLAGQFGPCQHEGYTVHAVCEMSPINSPSKCKSYQFRCDNGNCLNPDMVCDEHPDCPSAEDELNCLFQKATFTCRTGLTISIFKYCDIYVDCEDGSDESGCVHANCSQSQYRCNNGQCIQLQQRCDHQSNCVDHSDEDFCDWERECKGFKCPIEGCIPQTKFGDLTVDCPTEADERLSTDYFNYDSECPGKRGHQRCHENHKKCFPQYRACLYDHDSNNRLLYCSNGEHLRHCKDFECPENFKCPSSYCIPQHKVCDGVQDCSKGEDEMDCENRTCANLLRCGRSNQCVSLDYVCDGQVHCISGVDDEMFCELESTSCPKNCSCQGFGVVCVGQDFKDIPPLYMSASLIILDISGNNLNATMDTFSGYSKLAYLYLRNNSILSLPERLFETMPNLLLLDLSQNHLTVIKPNTFFGLNNLRLLNLSGNSIHKIFAGSFMGLSVLPELNLSGMRLKHIGNYSFGGLFEVTVLNLSNNLLSLVDENAFLSLPRLRILSLSHNNLDEAKADSLRNVNAQTVITDSYVFCCNVGHQVTDCSPAVNSYTSCSDLLPSEAIRGFVWTFAVLALVGNGGVILWRIFFEKNYSVPSIYILNLSIADLLMGVYLLSLSITDMHYKGTYTLNDNTWRHSTLCQTIGAVATLSCVMSMFTLVCIALDRTKRIAFPFTRYQFHKRSATVAMALGWIVCLLISTIPFSVPSYFGDYYSRNAVCLPFNFADPFGKGWEFSLFVFVALNAFGLLLIVIMYGLTYTLVKKIQTRAGRQDRMDLDVARKLTIIIVTDAFCVLPLTMTNLISVLGEPINRDMAAVLTTVILPINAALNPYLFTFSTIDLNKKRK